MTCLQPKDITNDPDFLLNIAPGEGKKTLGIHSDTNNEVMCFRQLFPDDKYGFDAKRQKKLTMKQYFNARILNCDNRFASSTEYLFYAQYRAEAKDSYDSISIAMRKMKKDRKDRITAADLKDPMRTHSLVRNDLNYHFLQKVQGFPRLLQ